MTRREWATELRCGDQSAHPCLTLAGVSDSAVRASKPPTVSQFDLDERAASFALSPIMIEIDSKVRRCHHAAATALVSWPARKDGRLA